MTFYQFILVFKFLAVLGFAGGAVASFVSDDPATRKRAVHRVASPALLAVWLAGYGLLMFAGLPLFELWIIVSVALSVVANGALAVAVSRGRRDAAAILWVFGPVTVIVVLMVLKLRWSQVLP